MKIEIEDLTLTEAQTLVDALSCSDMVDNPFVERFAGRLASDIEQLRAVREKATKRVLKSIPSGSGHHMQEHLECGHWRTFSRNAHYKPAKRRVCKVCET